MLPQLGQIFVQKWHNIGKKVAMQACIDANGDLM